MFLYNFYPIFIYQHMNKIMFIQINKYKNIKNNEIK